MSGLRNAKIPTDFTGEKLVDFGVPRHRRPAVVDGVTLPRMIAPLADEHATVSGKMPDEFPPFHTMMDSSS